MKRIALMLLSTLALGILPLAGGCFNVHVDPIEATVNLNVVVKMQQEIKSDLDKLYSGEVGAPPKPPATQAGAGA
jgi:hypothetical protein